MVKWVVDAVLGGWKWEKGVNIEPGGTEGV